MTKNKYLNMKLKDIQNHKFSDSILIIELRTLKYIHW